MLEDTHLQISSRKWAKIPTTRDMHIVRIAQGVTRCNRHLPPHLSRIPVIFASMEEGLLFLFLLCMPRMSGSVILVTCCARHASFCNRFIPYMNRTLAFFHREKLGSEPSSWLCCRKLTKEGESGRKAGFGYKERRRRGRGRVR